MRCKVFIKFFQFCFIAKDRLYLPSDFFIVSACFLNLYKTGFQNFKLVIWFYTLIAKNVVGVDNTSIATAVDSSTITEQFLSTANAKELEDEYKNISAEDALDNLESERDENLNNEIDPINNLLFV